MKPLPLILFVGAIAISAFALATDVTFAEADQNGDGQISLAEAVIAMPELTADGFDTADADASGALSETEFAAGFEQGVLPNG